MVVQGDLTEAALVLRRGELTAETLLDQHLQSIALQQPRLNCFVTLDEAGARAQAKASAARHNAGAPLSMLDGIPIALKDNIDVAGLPTSNGTAELRQASDDAAVTARLRAAGAVLLGKLNMHECALGATTDNPHHGPTHNPWRHGHTPGGSSGGSGAAVAAGLVLAALGTDTLGSVRLPAAYCGIVGLKATMGLISTRGVVPLSDSLDHIGPLCLSVRDSLLLLSLLAGEDVGQAGSVAAPPGWSPEPKARDSLQGLRIGVLDQAWTADLREDVAAGFTQAEQVLQDLGANLVPVSLPDFPPGALQRPALLVIEAEGTDALADPLRQTPNAFSDDLKSMLAYGRDAPAERLIEVRRLLDEAGSAVRETFDQVDLIASPTAPQTAFAFTDPVPVNQASLTMLANISGCPAITLPSGIAPSGLPLALQLMARPFGEAELLGAAQILENTWGRLTPPA
jgi:aspartyl-tRNA(Asn)/glutamyl-tRNA(Gln) amidotransferase subunit A